MYDAQRNAPGALPATPARARRPWPKCHGLMTARACARRFIELIEVVARSSMILFFAHKSALSPPLLSRSSRKKKSGQEEDMRFHAKHRHGQGTARASRQRHVAGNGLALIEPAPRHVDAATFAATDCRRDRKASARASTPGVPSRRANGLFAAFAAHHVMPRMSPDRD